MPSPNFFVESFDEMLQEVKTEVRSTAAITGIHQLSNKVLRALEQTLRHLFVDPGEEPYAYINRPLPIGEGQTISQPFIVAIMTELLDIQPTDTVLEIGTGSGYQAAILSKLAARVYTIEIFPRLAKLAKIRFQNFKYHNIHVTIGNGYGGWKENAPYDKIIVTAAAETIPQPLLDQLGPNGIMVIPLGKPRGTQILTVVRKGMNGGVTQKAVLGVSFVPFL